MQIQCIRSQNNSQTGICGAYTIPECLEWQEHADSDGFVTGSYIKQE